MGLISRVSSRTYRDLLNVMPKKQKIRHIIQIPSHRESQKNATATRNSSNQTNGKYHETTTEKSVYKYHSDRYGVRNSSKNSVATSPRQDSTQFNNISDSDFPPIGSTSIGTISRQQNGENYNNNIEAKTAGGKENGLSSLSSLSKNGSPDTKNEKN